MSDAAPLDRVLRRDRLVAVAALAAVAVLARGYVLLGAGMDMSAAMAGAAAPMPMAWTPGHAAVMALMMLAMMLPSAAPVILLHATVSRRRSPGHGGRSALLFALAYGAVWGGFALAATAAQWGLEHAALLTPAMAAGSAVLSSLLFLGAGVYQFTPLKRACLRRCRSPLEFLAEHWRGGNAGALRRRSAAGAHGRELAAARRGRVQPPR